MGARNSKSEWWFYWALSKALGTPANPRIPPFFGGEGWTYQAPYLGGRDVLGGSVLDFVVYAGASRTDPRLPFEDVGIRIESERFHIYRDSDIQQNDVNLFIGLSHILRVEDVFEQSFIGDETGQAAIVLAKQVLAGTAEINPITGGTARRVRT